MSPKASGFVEPERGSDIARASDMDDASSRPHVTVPRALRPDAAHFSAPNRAVTFSSEAGVAAAVGLAARSFHRQIGSSCRRENRSRAVGHARTKGVRG
jgi:hypothetical protein